MLRNRFMLVRIVTDMQKRITVSLPFKKDGKLMIRCPLCKEVFRLNEQRDSFSPLKYNFSINSSPCCGGSFDIGPNYSLPWLNYVPLSTRGMRLGLTASGTEEITKNLLKMVSHAVNRGDYGEISFEPDSYNIVRFDQRNNSLGIDSDQQELIFYWGSNVKRGPMRLIFASDDPKGAVERSSEILGMEKKPEWDGHTLIKIHEKMGFPEGLPYEEFTYRYGGIV